MANKALKGLTIKIGAETSELTKALDNVEKQGKSLSSELGQINKLLKMDPSNTELLAQKQKVLADAVGATEKKLDTLREAEKQAQEQFQKGEVSEEQYRALQREIIATEKKLDGYKKAAKETADAVEDLAKEVDDSSEKLEEQKQEAKEAADAVENMGDTMATAAKVGLGALTAAAGACLGAIVSLAEETREYRTEMGKLDTAYKAANFSGETAYKTYSDLQGVLGETDQAVEAANHLSKLCSTEEELQEWTDILTGVYAQFGSSLPIEGLAEAANETAKVGSLTGSLADALNWAGVSEDEFQLSLEACSDEQERQQLITKTLSELYKNSAAQYRETNAEIIRANKASEEWNRTLGEVGSVMEPVSTGIKELGTALLKEAKEPLKDVATWVSKKLLPALTDFGSWTKKNAPKIAATAAGLTAAYVAHKVATVAATAATKGMTLAAKAQAVAQKALNAVMAAGPWGLVATAVAGVTAALVVLGITSSDAGTEVNALTEEELKLKAAAEEAAKAFQEKKAATEDALGAVSSEMDYVQDLAKELQTLADESGKVKEKDQERAKFILEELNKALETEYTMVGDVIQQYDSLKTSIESVIQAKKAELLLEAYNEQYVAAIQGEAEALTNRQLAYKDYSAQLDLFREKEQEYLKQKQQAEQLLALGKETYDDRTIKSAKQQIETLEKQFQKEKDLLDKKQAAYDAAAANYADHRNTIANYQEAEAAALSGNYQLAVDLLSRKGEAYVAYSDKVDEETAKALDALYKEAVDAKAAAERTKDLFERGVAGYTEGMVEQAEADYEQALDVFANAYADAECIGEDIGEGMIDGVESKRDSLIAVGRSMVTGFLGAVQDESDSHSPSRKAIKLFEYIGEGAEIGIENKTPDVKQAGTRQAAAVLDAYSAQEISGQRALRNIAEQQIARQATGQMAVAATNGPMLEKILAAIEKGQVLAIDGDAIVGATVDRMDTALGRRRVLTTRGAL